MPGRILRDAGAIPEMVLLAVQRKGYVLESAYPGPATGPAAVWESDQTAQDRIVNGEPSVDLQATAFDARGLRFHSVDPGRDWYAAVGKCMCAGSPITLAINADSIARADPGNGVLQSMSFHGQNHMVTLVDVSDPNWDRIANSWSRPDAPWGDRLFAFPGTFRVKKGVLPKAASNVIAVDLVV